MISEARSATDSAWPRTGASAVPMARARSPFICSSPRPAWAPNSAPIHSAVAGEREDRAAVEAAEDQAEQRQQRVARESTCRITKTA